MTYVSMVERAQHVNLREVNALTARAYRALDWIDDKERGALSQVIETAAHGERKHRLSRGCGSPYRNFSVADAARLFAVRWIVRYAYSPASLPSIGDVFALRSDAFMCAAIVYLHGPEIRASIAGLGPYAAQEIMDLDYAVCMIKAEG